MAEWITTDWPDWKDAGRRVEVELEDGLTVQGELFVGDFFPDGEGDEVPVFSVCDDAGQEYSFAANKCWRFLHTGRDFLRRFEATLRRQQEPLGAPFASILAEHLDELYETEDKGSDLK